MLISITVFLFFFFQAEDGIRDVAVTGVQTCALPISIESVDQFCLENEALRLVNLSAFYNGEIFVYVAITSDLAGKSRHVSESIRTAGSNQTPLVRIDEGGAVEIRGDPCWRTECSVGVRRATGSSAV